MKPWNKTSFVLSRSCSPLRLKGTCCSYSSAARAEGGEKGKSAVLQKALARKSGKTTAGICGIGCRWVFGPQL